MKKKKWPDGFPCEVPGNDENPTEAHCDNCNEVFDANEEGILAKAVGNNGAFHKYAFCCYDCACEFSKDNGEMIIDRLNDSSPFNISFRLNPNAPADDAVADAVETINPEDVTLETKPEDERSEEAPTELNEVEMFTEEKPTCYEKKATECWKHVVKTAQEISAAASRIVILQDQLKDAKKEYDALVNRQNSYILNNGDSIQTTFDDMDSVPEPTITEDSEPAEPDNSWRSLPCDGKLPVKLTDKQWDAVRSAFPTLGDLQDWLSRDRREKIPGVSQTVYDKLVDALNNYVAVWQQEHNADKQTTEENDNV